MNIMVRLYTRHDLDLIALKKNKYFDFNKCLKLAVIAWARGDNYSIPSPPTSTENVFFELKPVALHFTLGKNEEDVIEKLKNIKYGYRNSFLKNLFRYYMCSPELSIYYDNTGFIPSPTNKKAENTESQIVSAPIIDNIENGTISEMNNTTIQENSVLDSENIPSEIHNEQNIDEKSQENELSEENIFTSQGFNNDSNNDSDGDSNDSFDLFGALDSLM